MLLLPELNPVRLTVAPNTNNTNPTHHCREMLLIVDSLRSSQRKRLSSWGLERVACGEEAADLLMIIARAFVPDAVASHAFEGGHIDHDGCSVLASDVAKMLSLEQFEFPLYGRSGNKSDVFQQF